MERFGADRQNRESSAYADSSYANSLYANGSHANAIENVSYANDELLLLAAQFGGAAAEGASSIMGFGDPSNWIPLRQLEFQVNEKVMYWSDTHKQWMDAIIRKVNRDDNNEAVNYDLDVKRAAMPSKIRSLDHHRNIELAAIELAADSHRHRLADLVELEVKERERYSEVDKAGPGPAFGFMAQQVQESVEPQFQISQAVEYWSDTYSQWMPAVVHKIRRDQGAVLYDLDVKRGAHPSKIRLPADAQSQRGLRQEAAAAHPVNVGASLPHQPQTQANSSGAGPATDTGAELAEVRLQTRGYPPIAPEARPETKFFVLGAATGPGSERPAGDQNPSMRPAPSTAAQSTPPSAPANPPALPPAATSASSLMPAQVPDSRSGNAGYGDASQEMFLKPFRNSTTAISGHDVRQLATIPQDTPFEQKPIREATYSTKKKPGLISEAVRPANQAVAASASSSDAKVPEAAPTIAGLRGETAISQLAGQQSAAGTIAQLKGSPEYRQSVPQTAPLAIGARMIPARSEGLRQPPLQCEDLQIGAGSFDPKQPHILSQIVAKLGLSGTPTVEPLKGFSGGRNEGVWFLTPGGQTEQYVLKLVSCQRCHQSVPTDAENFLKLSKDHPGLSNDKEVRYPLKVFACQNPGPRKYDLIVMRPAPGRRLAEVLSLKWHAKQIQEIMKILKCCGACLKRFHTRYGSTQHGDLQPSNVFWDDATEAVTFIDLGGMGTSTMRTDNEHFKKAFRMITEKWGAIKEDGCRAFDSGYNDGR